MYYIFFKCIDTYIKDVSIAFPFFFIYPTMNIVEVNVENI